MPLQNKEEPTSPQELLSEALFIAEEIESVVLIVRYKNRTNQLHWTNYDAIKAWGLLRWADATMEESFLETLEEEETSDR